MLFQNEQEKAEAKLYLKQNIVARDKDNLIRYITNTYGVDLELAAYTYSAVYKALLGEKKIALSEAMLSE